MASTTAATPATTALVLVDIQRGFDHPTYWGPRSNPSFEKNVATLLAAFRAVIPASNIFHIAHHSTNPKSALHPSAQATGFQPYAEPQAGEPIYSKTVNSAFVGTPLESEMRKRGIRRLYVCGLTSDRCVNTTVRMANNLDVLGYAVEGAHVVKQNIFFVTDCTATHDIGDIPADLVQKVHEATLGDEFCTLVTTKEAMAQVAALEGVQ